MTNSDPIINAAIEAHNNLLGIKPVTGDISMSREIKFRAYCRRAGLMSHPFSLSSEHATFDDCKSYTTIRCGVDSWEIMQYTGILDKNGVEIYEGDICNVTLSDSLNIVMKVEWYESGFQFKDNEGFWRVTHTPVEVIGNIYENPNLLEDNNNDK